MVLEILAILILGLVFGSFLGAFTWRLPRGIDFLKGRSFCPTCRQQIAWYDNIPIISYLILGGRCRKCRAKISSRYPLIEGLTAASFLLLYNQLKYCSGVEVVCQWQVHYQTAGVIILFIILLITISVFVIDLERRVIPDELIFAGLAITILPLVLWGKGELYPHLLAGLASALFLLLLNIITKGRGMGLGDVKFALLAGTFLGWPLMLIWLFLAFLTGAAVAIILILSGRANRKDKIAFGPFLAFAFAITSLWGYALLNWFMLSI